MNSDRRTILSLVALGRMTPSEAERLLAVLPSEDDLILKAAVCLAVVWLVLPHLCALFSGYTHVLVSLLHGALFNAHRTLASLTHWFGGLS